ncbi:MAG: hypothetical protein ACRBFS_26765 [Aureispira sp.]
MNQEIYFLYRDLPDLQRQYLSELFDKSLKMQRLVEVLEEKEKNFTTVHAVNYIYKEEIATIDFKVLTNRFYKLRKEFKEWLLQQLKHSPVCFTKEEQKLIYLRQLVINNEYTQALEALIELEARCWKLNLFELLYQVIELKIRVRQYTYALDLEQQQQDLKDYERASELLVAFNKCKNIGFQVAFDNSEKATEALKKVQKNIRPYRDYPRFKLFYHNVSFAKDFANIYANKQQTSRHLNAYKKLRKQHPAIPNAFFERHYQEKDALYFSIREASFYTNMNKHKQALALTKEVIEAERTSKIYLRKNLGYVHNTFVIGLCAKDYDFAATQIEDYRLFVEANDLDKDQYSTNALWLEFYSQAFPFYTTTNEKLEQLLSFSLEYEKKEDILYRGLRQFIHFKIYVIQQQWDKANAVIDNEHSLAFYEQYGQDFDFQVFFHKLLHLAQAPDNTAIYLLKKTIKKDQEALRSKLPPIFWSWLTWGTQLCNHYLKK